MHVSTATLSGFDSINMDIKNELMQIFSYSTYYTVSFLSHIRIIKRNVLGINNVDKITI